MDDTSNPRFFFVRRSRLGVEMDKSVSVRFCDGSCFYRIKIGLSLGLIFSIVLRVWQYSSGTQFLNSHNFFRVFGVYPLLRLFIRIVLVSLWLFFLLWFSVSSVEGFFFYLDGDIVETVVPYWLGGPIHFVPWLMRFLQRNRDIRCWPLHLWRVFLRIGKGIFLK